VNAVSSQMNLIDVSAAVGTTAVIGVNSLLCGPKQRIQAGSSINSYLVDKIKGAAQIQGGCFMGLRMPRGRTPLTAADINTIAAWIDSGAN
jgi:hypothetical protein